VHTHSVKFLIDLRRSGQHIHSADAIKGYADVKMVAEAPMAEGLSLVDGEHIRSACHYVLHESGI